MHAYMKDETVRIHLTPQEAFKLHNSLSKIVRGIDWNNPTVPTKAMVIPGRQNSIEFHLNVEGCEEEIRELSRVWDRVHDLLGGIYVELTEMEVPEGWSPKGWHKVLTWIYEYLETDQFEMAVEAIRDLTGDDDPRLCEAVAAIAGLDKEEEEE